MQTLFLSKEKRILETVKNKSEDNLETFICANLKNLFPTYTFIDRQFRLKGSIDYIVDILAYDSSVNRFVIFELKKDKDKNILFQAKRYRKILLATFPQVCWEATKICVEKLPTHIDSKAVDIILVAKNFNQDDKKDADDEKNITLIEYCWFENDIIFLNYVNNAPVTPQGIPKPTLGESAKPDDLKSLVEKWQNKVNGLGRKNQNSKLKKFGDTMRSIPLTKGNVPKLRDTISQARKDVNGNILHGLRVLLKQFATLGKKSASPKSADKGERQGNFSFSEIGIKPGAKLVFVYDKTIKCKVVGDRKVEYNGEHFLLTGLAKMLLNSPSGASVQGTMYFTYEGERLTDRRKRLKNED